MPNPAPSKETSSMFSPLTRLNLVILCGITLIYGALLLTEFLPSIIAMLAASLILTYLLLGPVRGLENLLKKIVPPQWNLPSSLRRALSIILVYLLCLGFLVLGLLRIAIPLSVQFKAFAKELPAHISKVGPNQSTQPHPPYRQVIQQTLLEETTHNAGETQISTQTKVSVKRPAAQNPKSRILTATSQLIVQKISLLSKKYAARLGRYVLDIGTTTLNGLIYTLTTLVLVFYLLHDGKAVQRGLVELMPTRHEAFAEQFLNHLHKQFYTVVKGQVLMGVLSGGAIYCLLLMMGIKYALLLGVVFGAASILPVIGPWLGLIPIVVIIEVSPNPINILPVLLLAGLFYLTKAYWLWPKLISRKFNTHPILFILTFLVCIKVMGFPGVFLSFPLASILGVWMEFQKTRHRRLAPQTGVLAE